MQLAWHTHVPKLSQSLWATLGCGWTSTWSWWPVRGWWQSSSKGRLAYPLDFNNNKITVRFIGDSGSARNLEVALVVETKRKPTRNSQAARNIVIIDNGMWLYNQEGMEDKGSELHRLSLITNTTKWCDFFSPWMLIEKHIIQKMLEETANGTVETTEKLPTWPMPCHKEHHKQNTSQHWLDDMDQCREVSVDERLSCCARFLPIRWNSQAGAVFIDTQYPREVNFNTV